MPNLPRLAIVNLLEPAEASACIPAIMAAFRKKGSFVQHFRSLAAFTPIDYVTPLTGIASRHLDPWIMSEELCRELFIRSASQVDLSIIEGTSNDSSGLSTDQASPNWSAVARMVNAPVIGVVRSQSRGDFHAQPLPAGIDALLIDGFINREHYEAEKASWEGIHGVQVLGGLAAGPSASECIERMQTGRRVPAATLDDLSRRFTEVTDMSRLLTLAGSRPLPARPPGLFNVRRLRNRLQVAVAYDECFHCYFPDTLDALEILGAEICEFSPLVDERLPAGTDIVYLGCGHPEKHAWTLATNECMRAAIRDHVCSGHRLYAEGGGSAYLCQQIRLTTGEPVPMVGLFPAVAELTGRPFARPQPVELRCRRTNWIAAEGDAIRGYRNGYWRLVARPGLKDCFAADSIDPEVVLRHHCIGSTVHLNFAAQPRVLDAFFAPHAPSLSI